LKKKDFQKKYLGDLRVLGRHDGLFSQSYQDQLIELMVGDFDVDKFCVEVGFNAKELLDGSGSNCANLVVNHGWQSLLLDAEYENESINLRKELLTRENIVEVFLKYRVPLHPGYISIDVDSIDLFLFKACAEKYRPLLYSVEYNANFPFNVQATASPNWAPWQNNKAFGASLSSLVEVADQAGYALLWIVEPFDAFFIKKEIFEKDPGKYVFNTRHFRKKTLIDVHKPIPVDFNHNFIDYKVYSKTNSIPLASESFQRKYSKYLKNKPQQTIRGKLKVLERLIKNHIKNFAYRLVK